MKGEQRILHEYVAKLELEKELELLKAKKVTQTQAKKIQKAQQTAQKKQGQPSKDSPQHPSM